MSIENKLSENKSESVESVQSESELRLKRKAERDQKELEEIKKIFEIVPKAKKEICSECLRVFPHIKKQSMAQFEELRRLDLDRSYTQKCFDKKIRCTSCFFEKFYKINEAHELTEKTKTVKKIMKVYKPKYVCPFSDYHTFNTKEELSAHLIERESLNQLQDYLKDKKEQKRKDARDKRIQNRINLMNDDLKQFKTNDDQKVDNSYNHFMSSGAE